MAVTPTQISFVVASVFGMLAMGGRVQIKETSLSAQMPKPNAIIAWEKGGKFVCAQKWEKHSNKHTGHYCLVDFEQVQEGTKLILEAQHKGKTTPRIRIASPGNCVAASNPSRMKVCNLKGKEDRRLHYSKRVLIPQLCFMQPAQGIEGHKITDNGVRLDEPKPSLPILEAAVDYEACAGLVTLPDSELGHLSPTPPVPTEAPAETQEAAPSGDEEEAPAEIEPSVDHDKYKTLFNKAAEDLAAGEGDDWEEVPDEKVETVEFPNFDDIKSLWEARVAVDSSVPKLIPN